MAETPIIAVSSQEEMDAILRVRLAVKAFRIGWELAQSGNYESLEMAEIVFAEMLEPTIGLATLH